MFILSPSAPNSRDLPRAFCVVSCNFVVAKSKKENNNEQEKYSHNRSHLWHW